MKNNICCLDLRGVYSGEGTSTQAAVYEAMYDLATSMLCLRIPFGVSHNQYATIHTITIQNVMHDYRP